MVIQLFFAAGAPGHVQPIGRPCSTWLYYAMKDVSDVGVKLGQNNRILDCDWPVSATHCQEHMGC